MKKTRGQDGSAHIVLIIVLIVVVLAGVGYVGYRAVTKQQAAAPTATAATNEKTAGESTREIIFDDWNVAFDVPKSSNLYVAKDMPDPSIDQTGDYYTVFDTDYDRICSGVSKPEIGSITRVKADIQADAYLTDEKVTYRQYFTAHPTAAAIVGDYAFFFVKPNGGSACNDPSDSNNMAAGAVFGKGVSQAASATKGLRLTK